MLVRPLVASCLRIRIQAGEGRGAKSGSTYAHNGALIRVGVGRFSDSADLKRDWIMTHEDGPPADAGIFQPECLAGRGARHLCRTDRPRPDWETDGRKNLVRHVVGPA